MFKFGQENNPPEGYRTINNNEIMNSYLKLDLDGSFEVSKNEWMLAFIKLLGNDMPALEKDGPDSIMQKIKELSDEFDRYDTDGNKYIDYEEYKKIITTNIFIAK